MKATYSADGNHVDVQIGSNQYSGSGLADEMARYGAVLYSSQWVGWVPGSCGGDGNLQASSFSVANLKIELEDTEAALADDKAFLADMEANCGTKEKEWDAIVKTRSEEIVAISETIKILNDDDALDLFKKAVPSASASFVQMSPCGWLLAKCLSSA